MIENKELYLKNISSASSYIQNKLNSEGIITPNICVVLGSGLAPLTKMCNVKLEIPYSDIPCFPVSTAPGHDGKLLVGELSGKMVFLMSGRFHYYEGYDYEICTFYVRVMANLKIETLVLTNAAGGLGSDMKPTDLMLIEDHISFFCESPLRGPNLDEYGVRFPDVSNVYDDEYEKIMCEVANDLNIKLCKGVYCYTKGPQYETPAEIRMLKTLGVGAVGMSTVPEAIVATHCGIRTVAVSCITNMAAGILPQKLTHEEVIENAGKASDNSCNLVKGFIERL